MNCPRCGSDQVKQMPRYEGHGKKRRYAGVVDEECLDCHWASHHEEATRPQARVPEGIKDGLP